MPARILWSPRALQRLTELGEQLEERSPVAARSAVRQVLEGVARLADHPQLGRPWSADSGAHIRRLVVGSYLVYYEPSEAGDQLLVLTVRHGRERPVEPEDLRGP